jgi:phosphohistidine phosphatase
MTSISPGTGPSTRTPTGSPRPFLTLWVLRHAEAASGSPPGGGDRARPLTARGRRDATALGRRLAAGPGVFGTAVARTPAGGGTGEGAAAGSLSAAMPEVVVCSPAVRTRQTAELVAAGLDDVPIVPDERLLGGDEGTVLQAVHEVAGTPAGVAVVGHNPTVFALTWALLDAPGSGDAPGRPAGGVAGGEGEDGDRHRLEQHGFPTCTVAAVTFAVPEWPAVRAGTGRLAALASPPY